MKEILFFYGPHCPKCPAASRLVGWHRVKVTRHNVEKADGLAEAAWYGVVHTPSIIVMEDDKVIGKFVGDNLPTREKIKELLK